MRIFSMVYSSHRTSRRRPEGLPKRRTLAMGGWYERDATLFALRSRPYTRGDPLRSFDIVTGRGSMAARWDENVNI